jgi:hypothetical protein
VTFLVLAAKAATSAAAQAQVDGVEYLSEARLAAAVSRLVVGQVLPTVCESGLRPIPLARAAMAQAFAMSMLAWCDLCLFCLPFSPGAGTTQRPRQAKGKANYQDAPQSLIIVEALKH